MSMRLATGALLLALPLLLVLLAWPAAASAQAPPQEPALEYELRVEAPAALREMLAERLPLARWQSDPQMNEALLERLVLEAEADAREAAATLGYFSAKVTSSIDRGTQPWTVVLRVQTGEPARVSSAQVRFSGPASEDPEASPLLRRIRREWALGPGERFTQDAWSAAKAEAARTLSGWRYAAARVAASRARVDPGRAEAALEVEVASGPAFRYGPTQVVGTRRYPGELIGDLSPARPGELYDREDLLLYERRLLATGYFVSAQASIAREAERAAAAPVRVAVIEAKSQQAETGLSFNTDVGVRAEARYRNMDLFDTAWRLRSEIQLDSRIKQGRIDLDTPPRGGGRWRNHFVQARDTTIQNERNIEYSAGLAYNWGLGGEPYSFFVSAHAEEQHIDGALADHREAVFFGHRNQWRRTDSWELPRRGYIIEVSVGASPAPLASRQFARSTARALFFIPLGPNDLLLRAEAGAVLAEARDGIPSTFLFRTGGDQTIRGYTFEALGVTRGAAVLGGRYLLIGSVEYVHWVSENWGIAAFLDGGNAWDGGRFEPVFGSGLGARFRTPVGPVRADLAYGSATRSFRLHFSVGFTF